MRHRQRRSLWSAFPLQGRRHFGQKNRNPSARRALGLPPSFNCRCGGGGIMLPCLRSSSPIASMMMSTICASAASSGFADPGTNSSQINSPAAAHSHRSANRLPSLFTFRSGCRSPRFRPARACRSFPAASMAAKTSRLAASSAAHRAIHWYCLLAFFCCGFLRFSRKLLDRNFANMHHRVAPTKQGNRSRLEWLIVVRQFIDLNAVEPGGDGVALDLAFQRVPAPLRQP